MPDPIVAADAQPAGSSPAAAPAPVAPAESLDTLSESQLHDWRLDGKLPSARAKDVTPPADSSPATPVQDPAASTDVTPEPASEAGTPRADPRATENRVPELLAERKRERERAERAERRLADLERQHQPPPDARPAASSAAPAGLVKPDPSTFDYGTSDPAYLEALTDYKVAQTLQAERQTREEGQRQARARDESSRVISAFEQKTEAARAVHPDFDDVAMRAETFIPPGSLADLFILENKADDLGAGGAEVLYHLQQPANLAEQKRILRLPLMDQIIALVRLGDRLKSGAPAASTTHAPPPPPTLSTRATPADAVERALATGSSDESTGAYIAAANRRDLARLKR